MRTLTLLLAATLVATACSGSFGFGGSGETEVATKPELTAAPATTAPATTQPPTPEAPPTLEEPTATPTLPADPTPEPTPTPGGFSDFEDVVEDDPDEPDVPATYDEFVVVTDDTGSIQVEVPAEWDEIDGRPYTDEQGRSLADVRVAPDLDGFLDTWDVPGAIITASQDVAQTENEETLLNETVGPFSEVCAYEGRQPYDDGLYTGSFDVFNECGGTETSYVIVGAVPDSRAYVIRVQVQVVSERDLDALERIIETFVITGDV